MVFLYAISSCHVNLSATQLPLLPLLRQSRRLLALTGSEGMGAGGMPCNGGGAGDASGKVREKVWDEIQVTQKVRNVQTNRPAVWKSTKTLLAFGPTPRSLCPPQTPPPGSRSWSSTQRPCPGPPGSASEVRAPGRPAGPTQGWACWAGPSHHRRRHRHSCIQSEAATHGNEKV